MKVRFSRINNYGAKSSGQARSPKSSGQTGLALLTGKGPANFSIFRTDFPALPGHIKKRTQLELNLMHLNQGKFDEKKRRLSIHGFVLQRVTLN
jgi:hypothetical protein